MLKNNKVFTPVKAIRKFCLWCMKENKKEVLSCPAEKCILWKYRMGKGRPKLRQIRQKCLECSGNSIFERNNCKLGSPDKDNCSLYPYRFGKRPRTLVGFRGSTA
jgi:hypothetical protein